MVTKVMNFEKVVRLGTLPDVGSVYCHIEFSDGRLSIAGVEGPLRNGDCRGGCGQIIMHLQAEKITPAPGWDTDLIRQFLAAWERWHLNDMRADCEHQRANWKPEEKIEVVTYKLTDEARKEMGRLIALATAATVRGEVLPLTATGRALLALEDWYRDRFDPPDADHPLSGCFEVSRREMKSAGWVRQDEHPRGLLSRACEVCGYEYGSAWLREEVPIDVLGFLQGLPDTDTQPAWI